MFKKFFWISIFLLFGFLVLVISVLRSASLRHSFNFGDYRAANIGYKRSVEEVGYFFVYPGNVLPGHPLWFLKVARDKFWLYLTPGATRKAELDLLFSDKRLMGFIDLVQKGRFSLALEALARSESYFKDAVNFEARARKDNLDTDELFVLLTKASFAHWRVLQEVKGHLPPEVLSEVEESIKYYLGFYRSALDDLRSRNIDISSFPKI